MMISIFSRQSAKFFIIRTIIIGCSLLLAWQAHARQEAAIGKIWSARQQEFISINQLINAVSDKKFILVGERHGRHAHQEREAFLLAALAEKGIYPDLFLEMLSSDQTETISNYVRQEPEYARRLAITLGWADSGWPDWSYYEPVFNIALMAKLKIIGADIPDQKQKLIMALHEHASAYEPAIIDSWRAGMKKAHCGLINKDRLFSITQLQILRDKAMADAMNTDRRASTPALLIAGSAHTRKDRGIPRYLDKEDVVSIALVESGVDQKIADVIPKAIDTKGKDDKAPVYDYVWFTPRVEKESLCEKLNGNTQGN